jgi:predicted nuclease of predicted toxin-antitoxin system
MSFLLDQNISFRVAGLLSSTFDNVKHVKQLGLVDAYDLDIWKYAKTNNYTIITFDSDFIDFAILKGYPPKIIWLRFGNASNLKIVNKLISNEVTIKEFLTNQESAFLEIE